MIRAKWILFIIIGVIVLGTLNSSIVSSMELKNGEMQKAYLQSLEKELRTSLRKELDDRGYINAGITMTKIIYDENRIEYQVEIHHKNLVYLQAVEKNNMIEELNQKMDYNHWEDAIIKYCFS